MGKASYSLIKTWNTQGLPVSQVVLTHVWAILFTKGPELQFWPFLGLTKADQSIFNSSNQPGCDRLKSTILPDSALLSGCKNRSRGGRKMQLSQPESHPCCASIPPNYVYWDRGKGFCSFQQTCTHPLGSVSQALQLSTWGSQAVASVSSCTEQTPSLILWNGFRSVQAEN